MKLNVDQIHQHLDRIRHKQGEEAFKKARCNFARSLILAEGGSQFLSDSLGFKPDELAKLEAEAREMMAAKSPEAAMSMMLKQQLPHCKTQAQFNLFMAAFEALRAVMDATFAGNEVTASKARELLNRIIDQAAGVTRAVSQLEDEPEAAQGALAEELKKEPIEFHEHDEQRQLLAELSVIQDRCGLDQWYAETQSRREGIRDQALRNELYDEIRRKRGTLTAVFGNQSN